MLAFAMLAVIRQHGEGAHAPKNPDPARPEGPDLIRWSVQEIRRVAVRLAQRRVRPARVIARPPGGGRAKPPHGART